MFLSELFCSKIFSGMDADAVLQETQFRYESITSSGNGIEMQQKQIVERLLPEDQ
jgi:hypothetical protein